MDNDLKLTPALAADGGVATWTPLDWSPPGTNGQPVHDEAVLMADLLDRSAQPFGVGFPDGRLGLFNKAFRDLLGYTQEELHTLNWSSDLTPPEWAEAERASLKKLQSTGLPVRYEKEYIRRDGQRILVELLVHLIGDAQGVPYCYYAFVTDITARRQTELALRASEAKYRRLHESMTDAFVCVDMEGRILEFNRAYQDMLGYTTDELQGLNFIELTPTAWHAKEASAIAEQIQSCGYSAVYEKEYRKKDGSTIPVELRTFLLRDDDGHPTLMWAIVRDLTAWRQAEAERRALEAKMLQTQKLESLGVLAGGIAHDFNNLLMAIMGNADLALDELAEDAPARPLLREVNKASQRAAELCQQMLAYSGHGSFAITQCDLSELVRDMGQMLAVSVSKKATLCYQLARQSTWLEADVTQLRQVVMNLIINASEAIGDTEGTITISTDCVTCDRTYLDTTLTADKLSEGAYVRLRVADTGSGMDGATRTRIFDPFFSTKLTGRGLGLAAVLGIVRGHRGTIRVDSAPGAGAMFEILLPAFEGVRATASSEIELELPPWTGQGLVLLVDDEAAVRDLGRRMLERVGLQVILASDGHQALEIFRARRTAIRCIILDLTMPRMDGVETLRTLREIDPGVCVILSSGYNEQDVQSRLGEHGAAGFIQKPYQLGRLSDMLRQVLKG